MKRVTHKVIRHFLLLLFIAYGINISFFIHSHVVNGVTIVHSHFYKGTTDSKGKPAHGHSSSEIQLISVVSDFATTGEVPESFVADNSPRLVPPPVVPLDIVVSSAQSGAGHYLRAPPQQHI